jgi:hypothetical protein
MPSRSPDLTLPLAQPITLTRGPRSHLVTLMDAANLICDDIAEATRQLLVCVEHKNWRKT